MARARRPRPLRIAALLAAAFAFAALTLHGFAWWQWRASFGGESFAQRLARAERAAAIEPWNAEYRARPDWVSGTRATARDRPADAYFYLHRAADVSNRDPRLRRELKQAYAAWSQATTWKAHVQHAREQTGGVLLDEDWIP